MRVLLFYPVLLAGIIVTFIFLIFRSKEGANLKNLFLKMSSSLLFMTLALVGVVTNQNPTTCIFGVLIIMGGALGLCGDITLDLKYVYPDQGHGYLISGFIFFAIGHVFYNVALVWLNKLTWWWVVLCVVGAFVVSTINVNMGKIMKLDYGKYKLISIIYGTFLVTTTFVSILSAIVTVDKAMIVFAIGAVLFLLSDLILSTTYFGKDCNKPVHIFTNHLAYYGAQFLIASSVALIEISIA